MAQIPYYNDSDKVIHVGGKSIAPGETRVVDETWLSQPRDPVDFKDLDADLTEPTGLAALLDKPVKEVTDELSGLDDEQLAELEQIEADGKKRKGVIAAISELRMERAAVQLGGEDNEGGADD